jgi:predicted ATP-dependent endonuclease of OLD family
VYQPTKEILNVFWTGIEINKLLQNIIAQQQEGAGEAKNLLPNEDVDEDDQSCMEMFRYQLWLDSERLSLFFSDTVILVEGATEKVFLNYQLARDWESLREHKICVVDVNGKYNFHRYMKLLEAYGINHIVICDGDSNRKIHKAINPFIISCHNKFTLSTPYFFEKDLEDFLGYEAPKRQDIKPITIMQKLEKQEICALKLNELSEILRGLLIGSQNEEVRTAS